MAGNEHDTSQHVSAHDAIVEIRPKGPRKKMLATFLGDGTTLFMMETTKGAIAGLVTYLLFYSVALIVKLTRDWFPLANNAPIEFIEDFLEWGSVVAGAISMCVYWVSGLIVLVRGLIGRSGRGD